MEPSRPGVDVVLDTLGKLCPLPIIDTQARVRGMEAGQVIEVVSDDVGILADMPLWCKGSGHTLIDTAEDEAGLFHCFVRV